MDETPVTGRVIAERYRLIGPLGEGGTGVAWLARDELLRREVAVKEIRVPPDLDPTAARLLFRRLEDGARSAGRISHRNVVAVHEVVAHGGRPWIVMEPARGLALSELLEADGPLPARQVARIGAEALAGLRAAHAAGVPHGNVTPSKVLLVNDGRVLVTGFGTGSGAAGVPPVTQGAAADLRALGAVLFTAVEGRGPRGDAPRAGRAGAALAEVVEGLLRRDAAGAMSAAEAEHRLRLAGAGGAVPPAPAAGAHGPPPAGAAGARAGSGAAAGRGSGPAAGSAGPPETAPPGGGRTPAGPGRTAGPRRWRPGPWCCSSWPCWCGRWHCPADRDRTRRPSGGGRVRDRPRERRRRRRDRPRGPGGRQSLALSAGR
ncbi:serine/threonine protein kinase [Streptomyces sp. C10-9-1]|uniref:serine/threonine-protein kinase n=1 Tax=Streptomyces sp. C10-9-1 TaxID=1859285 RepID=UPI0021138459|nr:serine/threonine-protein kinase [Streptomyces sp. C10-9-1]MCQ6554117.1 serine/threonine protein kinase [Streptomyces sp. C10-9-1]